ncbi:hypothetical protein [Candidatus Trichorickettsia mobilis]|uniref:hypothetical protein n=1 Tax=Candidatus Trichorickettsia mobilis TaxID=1346319 RepID=UPI0029301EA7|nr:hypothetical protein [Candidatus Trichorickettsia mobilis]
MKRIEVKSKEYIIVTLQDELVLYTKELNQEIAYSIFSAKLEKVALARNLDQDQLIKFFAEINPNNIQDSGLIKVNIIGGNESESSVESLHKLLLQLQTIDNNQDIIDIRSCDSCEKLHPNSFELDCYHGGIRGITIL